MEIINGKTYRIKSGTFKDSEYRVEGTDREVFGGSWGAQNGNFACMDYAMRSVRDDLPMGGTVYYGKIGIFGKVVHESEIGEEIKNE